MKVRFVVQVLRGGEWEIVGKYSDRYTASVAYNTTPDQPRRMLEIGEYGGAIIRDSYEDGKAASFHKENHK